jgi:hypothetical protein
VPPGTPSAQRRPLPGGGTVLISIMFQPVTVTEFELRLTRALAAGSLRLRAGAAARLRTLTVRVGCPMRATERL